MCAGGISAKAGAGIVASVDEIARFACRTKGREGGEVKTVDVSSRHRVAASATWKDQRSVSVRRLVTVEQRHNRAIMRTPVEEMHVSR